MSLNRMSINVLRSVKGAVRSDKPEVSRIGKGSLLKEELSGDMVGFFVHKRRRLQDWNRVYKSVFIVCEEPGHIWIDCSFHVLHCHRLCSIQKWSMPEDGMTF